MNEAELYEYIKNRKYLCDFCAGLQKQVMEKGLSAITDYKGFICSGVMDMQIRLSKINGRKKIFKIRVTEYLKCDKTDIG